MIRQSIHILIQVKMYATIEPRQDSSLKLASVLILRWNLEHEVYARANGKGGIFTARLTSYDGTSVLFRSYEFADKLSEYFS